MRENDSRGGTLEGGERMMGERETPSSPSKYTTLKFAYNRISFEYRFTRNSMRYLRFTQYYTSHIKKNKTYIEMDAIFTRQRVGAAFLTPPETRMHTHASNTHILSSSHQANLSFWNAPHASYAMQEYQVAETSRTIGVTP